MSGAVVAVHRSPKHSFSKQSVDRIMLMEGLGVEGDAHMGTKVKHRHHARYYPDRPNLRQVHLIAQELIDEINAEGFDVLPGALGENITTQGIDLINLPRGTRLHLGHDAIVEVTGLRSPCVLIERFREGLLKRLVGAREDGSPLLLSGIMGIVVKGGDVATRDGVDVRLPTGPHVRLEKV